MAYACLSKETMPTKEREKIGMIKPSGWQTVKYPDIIDDLYLYNRCHLIAWCLSGENANEKNLITGTRYMNVDGMLPFENMIDDYVDETENHVLYRVTPIYEGGDFLNISDSSEVSLPIFSSNGSSSSSCSSIPTYRPGVRM